MSEQRQRLQQPMARLEARERAAAAPADPFDACVWFWLQLWFGAWR